MMIWLKYLMQIQLQNLFKSKVHSITKIRQKDKIISPTEMKIKIRKTIIFRILKMMIIIEMNKIALKNKIYSI
jgi:hypothetical protein